MRRARSTAARLEGGTKARRSPPATTIPEDQRIAFPQPQHTLEVVGVVREQDGPLEVVDEHERPGVVSGMRHAG